MWRTWTHSQGENLIGQFTPAGAVQTMNLMKSVSLGVIWLFSLQVQEPAWRFNQTRTIDWSYLCPSITGVDVFYFSPSTQCQKKTSRLSKLALSVIEAQIRCGSEWPIGLVDAIAEAHRTTVENVVESQRIFRPTEPQHHKLNVYFWDHLSFLMSLSWFIL